MKSLVSILALTIVMLTSFTSCKKEDNPTPSSSTKPTSDFNSNLQQGKWKVIYYDCDGINETYIFNGCQFQFNTDETVIATSPSSSVNGKWESKFDDNKLKLILDFDNANPFSELNEDWHVTQQNSSLINLEHESNGSGGKDYLTFEKI